MSKQISEDFFMNKINQIYDSPNIKILEWNGYTGKIKYYCYNCGQEHELTDARNLLSTFSYCKKNSKTNKKFTKDDFSKRLKELHEKEIEIIEYKGLSNPLIYKCLSCGQLKKINPARGALYKFSLCDECDGVEKNIVEKKIKSIFTNNPNYELLTYHGVSKKMRIKCNNCGYIFERYPSNVINCPDSCPNCNNGWKKQMISDMEIQKRIDEGFGEGLYTLLEYKGQLNKDSKIKCNNCGLIFSAQLSTFIKDTRGCPKCKRHKSKGEQLVEKYLKNNNIKYETQKRFKDCNNNLSSFDFCVFDKANKMYLIEVNGIQHYTEVKYFEGLSTIQRRDKIKENYCKNNNIPLIIIPYTDLIYSSLDKYLSFLKGSTTIS